MNIVGVNANGKTSNVNDIETKRIEASILAFFKYRSETNLAYSKILKDQCQEGQLTFLGANEVCPRAMITALRASWVFARQQERMSSTPLLRQCLAHRSFYLANFWIPLNFLQNNSLNNSLEH
jgi:hypothetical protein